MTYQITELAEERVREMFCRRYPSQEIRKKLANRIKINRINRGWEHVILSSDCPNWPDMQKLLKLYSCPPEIVTSFGNCVLSGIKGDISAYSINNAFNFSSTEVGEGSISMARLECLLQSLFETNKYNLASVFALVKELTGEYINLGQYYLPLSE